MTDTESARANGVEAPRWLELGLLFFVLPLVLAWVKLAGGHPVPVIPTLVGVAGFTLIVAWRDPSLHWRDVLALRWSPQRLRSLALRFAMCAALLTAVVAVATPEELFRFPRERPGLWALVIVLYPLLSVLPQEFLYRTFFFHRYQRLLGSRGRTILASALVFGLAHTLFGNWVAVALTIVGGWFFARTFAASQSLWLTSLEHSLYGQLVFTIGLGHHFYGGTVQALGGS